MTEYISLGMYITGLPLRQAWRALFNSARSINPEYHIPENIVFNSDRETLLRKTTRIGHTCGYPLMTRYSTLLTPLCVPCFNAEGCEGSKYSSHFLVRRDSNINQLEDCRDHIAVINGLDSNSGMNVFRAAISEIHKDSPNLEFFKAVKISGSHVKSVDVLLAGEADIAAIDAVTLAFIKKDNPKLDNQLRTIAFSKKTTGLPFVTHIDQPFLTGIEITDVLNSALNQIEPEVKQLLMIDHFETVEFQDYQSIVDLEQCAIENGYPILR